MIKAIQSFILALVSVMVLFAGPAAAGPDRASILLGSKHLGATMEFNETNPGLFLTWEDRGSLGLDYSVGGYHNSYGKGSVAATVGKTFEVAPDFDIGIFGGAAYYPENGRTFGVHAGDFVPMVGAQARYKNAFVQVLPSDGIYADAIVSFGVTFSLK